MTEKRIGRQTPTTAVILPYTSSLGTEAVEIYNKSGRTAQQWQELLLEDIMALNEEQQWVHMKFGWSVPRRNGKSEVLIIRAVYAVSHGERVLYTAHRTTTSHNAWEKIIERLAKAGFTEGEDFKTTKQYGLEHIEWLDGDGVINFRTRSSKGGLGEGYDLLIIDEAQEYTSDQESALKYVVTDSKNPQTLMCGTPPTAVSSGTVFLSLRRDILGGNSEDAGWAEWSAIAKFMGGIAVADRENRIKFRKFGTAPVLKIPANLRRNINLNEYTFGVRGVAYRDKFGRTSVLEIEGGKVNTSGIPVIGENSYIWETPSAEQEETDRQYRSFLKYTAENLKLPDWTPGEVEYYGNPALELGDMVEISGGINGKNSTNFLITAENWVFRGAHTLISAGAAENAVTGGGNGGFCRYYAEFTWFGRYGSKNKPVFRRY